MKVSKKKLLLVIGAGASLDFGMPSVEEAGDIISTEAQQFFSLADRPHTNLYKHIEEMVKRYWKKHVPLHLWREPQFEDILYAIFGQASAFPAGAYTSALGALIKAKKLPDINRDGVRFTVSQHQLGILSRMAIDALLTEIRERCRRSIEANAAEFARLRSFMTALQTAFEIAAVTLNYDNILYRALPGIETGFHPTTGRFHEERIFGRTAWPCILHLHGSVHFDMPTPPTTPEMHEIFWNPDINATFAQNAFGRSSEFYPEGADFPTSVIIAGYGKTMQILRRPFRTYYSELDRLVSECDAVLLAGYGCGDEHVNIAFERFRDARRRPVAMIQLAKKGDLVPGWAEVRSPVAKMVVHTFRTELRAMLGEATDFLPTVDRLLEMKEFQISNNCDTRLGVWYNGLLEACDNPGKVIAVLGECSD
jgi:hypothetical protein